MQVARPVDLEGVAVCVVCVGAVARRQEEVEQADSGAQLENEDDYFPA